VQKLKDSVQEMDDASWPGQACHIIVKADNLTWKSYQLTL